MLYLILFWLYRVSQRLETSAQGLGIDLSAVTLLLLTLAFPQTNEHVVPLLQLVVTQRSGITQTSDIDIWAADLDLVTRTRPITQPTTPPTSCPSLTSTFQ